ncbi:hypothetical protein B5G38_15410 [Gemmiger sp. An87]|nr:hypothetical protein B5G38_15410 [Gemmiger sp. An87]
MLKFTKGRWFPLILTTAILVLAAIIVLIMALFGWRFTYAPELENSWNAISSVAAWTGTIIGLSGVVASFLAVWFAIQVPKKIADRQDKIALFEKRYECFQIFEKLHVLYKQIKDKECALDELRERSKYLFGKLEWKEISKEIIMDTIEKFEYTIHQMQFLFPEVTEQDASQLYFDCQDFLISLFTNQEVQKKKKKYTNTMDSFLEKYLHAIVKSLSI